MDIKSAHFSPSNNYHKDTYLISFIESFVFGCIDITPKRLRIVFHKKRQSFFKYLVIFLSEHNNLLATTRNF